MPSLQDLLVDLVALSLEGKQLHWHVQGPNFVAVHRQLDEIIDDVRGYADDVAERSVALGVPVDARPEVVGKEHRLPGLPEGWVRDEDAVRLYADAIEGVAQRARTLVDRLGDELVSQDLVIGIVAGLEKHLWMLRAQQAR